MRQGLCYTFGLTVLGLFGLAASPAAADSVGPYYATPSWDQTLPSSTRLIVLSNMNGDAVLDRETGLVWEKAPSATEHNLYGAWNHCIGLHTGGRMGWRVPKSDELFTLLDPSQISNVSGGPAALPLGHPFVGTGGNPNYWTTDQNPPPFNDNLSLVFVATDQALALPARYDYIHPRAWCVRGPGSAQMSP